MSLQKITARRTVLIERIAQQRDDIARLALVFERPAKFFDKGYALVQKVRHSPKLILGISALTAVIFRKRLAMLLTSTTLLKVAQWGFLLNKK